MGAYGVYHERQTLELCALHALNNLFQGETRSLIITSFVCVDLDALLQLIHVYF